MIWPRNADPATVWWMAIDGRWLIGSV